jgi:hypothetical protein
VTYDDEGQAELLTVCAGVSSGDVASLSLLFRELADRFDQEPASQDEVLNADMPAAALAQLITARSIALRAEARGE